MIFPNTGAPLWAAAQASPWVPVNEAGYIWDAFASRSIIEDRDLTAPPVICANGDRYLIDAPATGLWAGHDGELAIAIGTNASNGWYFALVALHGNQLFIRDESLLIEYDGAAWITAPGGVSFMDDLTDVDAPTPASGDMLRHNGSEYVNDVATDTDVTLAANSDSRLPTQKAVRTYVNASLAGLSWKQAVRVATTAAGTLATDFESGDTVDGVVLATGNRILIKNQAAGAENGIYVVAASGAPTRAADADSGGELVNASVFVSEGTANADTQWTCTTNATITVGVTSLVFAQFVAGGYGDANARAALGRPIAGFFSSTPTADETLLLYPAVEAITFAANFAGSFGKIGINPTASFVLEVYKNPTFTGLLITGGTVIGTITIGTGGAFTFATTGGTSQALAAGNWIGIKGPTTPDATVACAAFNLLGAL